MCLPKPHLKFVSYMQVICIILVVLGHSFHLYPDGRYGESLVIKKMIYSFHMPAFMFVSGFLMCYSSLSVGNRNDKGVFYFFVQKFSRLLLPYLVLTAVTFIPRASLNFMADDNISIDWMSFIEGFFIRKQMLIPYFWFVQASFLLLVFSYSCIKILVRYNVNRNWSIALLMILFFMLPLSEIRWTAFFSLDMAIELGLYFCLGIIYANWFDKIDLFIKWDSLIICALFIGGFMGAFFVPLNYWTSMLCAILGIGMVISLAHIIENRKITVFDHLTGANYMIFLLSWYFNVLAQQVLAYFVTIPWYVHTLLSLFSGIYVPYAAYIWLRNKQNSKIGRITAVLLGQKFPKKQYSIKM